MDIKFIKNKQGISIIEVIAAIMIITIGMIGVLSLVIQNIKAQYINKNVLIASGLAQEGLELVRNIRDNNWLAEGNNWKLGDGVDPNTNITQDGEYAIDYSLGIIDVDDLASARLYIDSNGFYTGAAAGNAPTDFYRLITVLDQGDYLDVISAIRWNDGGQNHYYTAETYLYDWR
ncbi:MAG: hypothetical protein Q8O93_05025 [bacterium]|nr:hypothetical protein [bacterium]